MTASHDTTPNAVREIYEEVNDGSATVGRIRDPLNENAWIQSTLTLPVGAYDSE